MALNLRQIEIFRPYEGELPEALLWEARASEADVAAWMSAEMVRIAKLDGEVVGMYAMHSGDDLTYVLCGVVVEQRVRKQGLGRWLVGHALGVAESKGGRHVLFEGAAQRRFFARIGFVQEPRGQRFDLIQE